MCDQHKPHSPGNETEPVNTPPHSDTPGIPPLFVIGCFLAASFWIFEAYMDSIFMDDVSFAARLFPSDPNELWMRGLVSVILIGFGMYAEKTQASILRSKALNLESIRLFRSALSKTISGNFPICSVCKDIHVHGNIWISPEHFISAQSEAEFTSSICKRCQTQSPRTDNGLKAKA